MRFNLIIKFVLEEHLQDFLDGNLFMNKVGNYINLEEEQKDTIIGDRYEGHHVEDVDLDRYLIMIEVDGKRVPLNGVTSFVSRVIPTDLKKVPIFSFLMLSEEDFDYYESEGLYKMKESVLEEIINDFSGRIGISINDYNGFIDKIKQKEEALNTRIICGPVNYYDNPSNYPMSREEFEKDPVRGLFNKRKDYKNQREYRIVVEDLVEESMFLELGDLSNMVSTFPAEELHKVQFKEFKNEQ